MREIKFRAYDGMDWIYSSAVEYRKEDDQWLIYDFELEEWMYCSKPEQYTGLKDKNGTEIYEGDVLSDGGREVLMCEVVYDAPSFSRRWLNKRTASIRGRELEPLAWNTHIIHAVVGNIYENPELLAGDSN